MEEISIYEEHPISSIELLGYAKNYIVEAKEIENDLPEQQRAFLSKAYSLLDSVQKCLYCH